MDAVLVISAAFALVVFLQFLSGASPVVSVIALASYLGPLFAVALFWIFLRTPFGLEPLIRLIVWSLPVQAVLCVLQATTPVYSRWNAVGDSQVSLITSDGVARASGTFVAPIGLTAYVAVSGAALVILAWQREPGRFRTVVGTISWVMVLATGGSRGAVLTAAVLMVFVATGVVLNGSIRSLGKFFAAAVCAGAAFVAIKLAFSSVLDAFGERFESASQSEDTLARIIRAMFGYVEQVRSMTLLGDGAATHSLAGKAAGSPYAWVENELDRLVVELGLLGFLIVVARQLICLTLLVHIVAQTRLRKDVGVWAAFAALLPMIFYGGVFAPSTLSGSAVVSAVLLLHQVCAAKNLER
ncbi:MAG: hypothetical protein F2693_07580 [Actinobacteria bacterium]|nr:hypothetical protein [Actinomycetota bacterium]